MRYQAKLLTCRIKHLQALDLAIEHPHPHLPGESWDILGTFACYTISSDESSLFCPGHRHSALSFLRVAPPQRAGAHL